MYKKEAPKRTRGVFGFQLGAPARPFANVLLWCQWQITLAGCAVIIDVHK